MKPERPWVVSCMRKAHPAAASVKGHYQSAALA